MSQKIGVLMGGDSEEREISLRSGQAIAKALRSEGLDVVEIGEKEGVEEGVLQDRPDLVFIALHGKHGEDGTIQAFLEKEGIPYTGSGEAASRLAMDKVASKKVFQEQGIPTPDFYFVRSADSLPEVEAFPVVVKPSKQGSSFGMSIVEEPELLAEAVELALRYDDDVLIEQFVRGRELTVGVLEEESLPVVEILPKSGLYDYHSKYTVGETEYQVPAQLAQEITQQVQQVGLQAHQALGCRHFSRTDVLLSEEGRPFVLEVNTIPGFTETSLLPKAAAAVGLSFEQLCLKILECAQKSAFFPSK